MDGFKQLQRLWKVDECHYITTNIKFGSDGCEDFENSLMESFEGDDDVLETKSKVVQNDYEIWIVWKS